MRSTSSGMNKLKLAANALKSTGSLTPVDKQIDVVSNALTGTHRKRGTIVQEKGYPPEAKNVLENLKLQVNEAIFTLSDWKGEPEEGEHLFKQFVENLEIIETFADRITTFYYPEGKVERSEDKHLTNAVKQSFAKAKTEAISTLALEKVFHKITGLTSLYRNNPQMTRKEYRERLNEFSLIVRKWEDELLAKDPVLKNSRTVASRVYLLKDKLHEAFQISEIPDHPGILGETGLDVLRLASDMVQQAKNQFEVTQAVNMAIEANRDLKSSGKLFQERGRSFNLLIQQNVVNFVGKEIRKIEKEMLYPQYYIPGDMKKNEAAAKRLFLQMEQLITYFEFVRNWAGPHLEDLLERLALVYEQIATRAHRGKDIVLDELAKFETEDNDVLPLAQVAAKFRHAQVLGRDTIDPNKIFNEPTGVPEQLEHLLGQLPDPSTHADHLISYSRLGRLFSKARTLKNNGKTLNPEDLRKLAIVITRIEYYTLKQEQSISIFHAMQAKKEYFSRVREQETRRFLNLLGVDPSATAPERYAEYPDPSSYPFKRSHLLNVVKNFRLIGNFLHGRYGILEEYPSLQIVRQTLVAESDGFDGMVRLEFFKRLNVSFSEPPSLVEIQKMIQAKIELVPLAIHNSVKSAQKRVSEAKEFSSLDEEVQKMASEAQELWLMHSLLTSSEILRDSTELADSVIQECKKHENIAREIIVPIAKQDPDRIRKLVLNSLSEVIRDAERISFEMNPDEMLQLNQKHQFFDDHQIPDAFPMFVQGITSQRQAGEDVHQRLLELVGSDEKLKEVIINLGTKSFLRAPVKKIRDLLDVLIGVPGMSELDVKIEDMVLFLSLGEDRRGSLTGYAEISVLVPDNETKEPVEFAEIVLKAEVEILKSGAKDVRISFINQPFNSVIAQERAGKTWSLL